MYVSMYICHDFSCEEKYSFGTLLHLLYLLATGHFKSNVSIII